jgi:four helix bundle protein
MKTRHFRDLIVWQRAMKLASVVYAATKAFPKEEMFGLTSQIRRAAVSVPSNIAEGHGRLTDNGFAVFLGQARGSLFEVETQIELASTLGYIKAIEAEKVIAECEELAKMLNGLLKTLKEKEKSLTR